MPHRQSSGLSGAEMEPPRRSLSPTGAAVLLSLGLVFTGFAIWALAGILFLFFAALLLSILLRSLGGFIETHTPVNDNWSLALAGLILFGAVAAFVTLLGAQLSDEWGQLVSGLPGLVDGVGRRAGFDNLAATIIERLQGNFSQQGALGRIAGYTSTVAGVLTNIALVIAAGIYLAAQHDLYWRGTLQLFPAGVRPVAANALGKIGAALRLWILGQLISMTLVGTLTTLGLWMIGIPSALALGSIAGLAEFIPLIGPVLGAIPAVLVASNQGTTELLWVLGLFLVIQQLEGNLIMPLVQQNMVKLPPVLTLFAVVGFGSLFGFPGALLGAPLAVVLLVAVKELYVRRTLGEDTEIPGSD